MRQCEGKGLDCDEEWKSDTINKIKREGNSVVGNLRLPSSQARGSKRET